MSHHTTRPALPRPLSERFTQLPDGLHQIVASPREFQLIAALLSYRWTPDAEMFPFGNGFLIQAALFSQDAHTLG